MRGAVAQLGEAVGALWDATLEAVFPAAMNALRVFESTFAHYTPPED